MSTKKYGVIVGEKDAERLKIQHETFAPGTLAFIKKLGIKLGDKVCVVGSGAGDESLLFSSLVGAQGKVLGIDNSPDQIRVANSRIKQEKILNVEFKEFDVNNILLLEGEFDFIYCRMVLTHLPNVEDVLNKMFAKVKEGGILACEEPVISSGQSFPPSEALNEHIRLLSQLIKKRGGDPELGDKLYNLLAKLTHPVEISLSQPAVTDSYLKRAVYLSAISCGPGYIAEGLINSKKLEIIAEGIQSQVVEPKSTVLYQCRMTQVSVKKIRKDSLI
jgi:ubiquinone/menaquinone biosynthesis C-methylase UbiE